jgi:hypothetical protein
LRFHRFQDEIRREQKREKLERFQQEFDHSAEIASLGHCAAHAPQSTHLSASIV